jgi:hypothetical protein
MTNDIESLQDENRQLKEGIERLRQENEALRSDLYKLSLLQRSASKGVATGIDSILEAADQMRRERDAAIKAVEGATVALDEAFAAHQQMYRIWEQRGESAWQQMKEVYETMGQPDPTTLLSSIVDQLNTLATVEYNDWASDEPPGGIDKIRWKLNQLTRLGRLIELRHLGRQILLMSLTLADSPSAICAEICSHLRTQKPVDTLVNRLMPWLKTQGDEYPRTARTAIGLLELVQQWRNSGKAKDVFMELRGKEARTLDRATRLRELIEDQARIPPSNLLNPFAQIGGQ